MQIISDDAIKELASFIFETGFFDVANRNFLVVEEDGIRKIAIIDFEYVDPNRLDIAFKGGFIDGSLERRTSEQETIPGLFKMLPDSKEVIKGVLKECNREDLVHSETV